ncbi:hypothetical protein [Kribbella catacumbae]|uniref:hypothetical protein n=1 Tax=Kribbella catacumbae TaxID=460086 RepID=UPI00036B8F3E|nr:hypothetical protein [Kribbella catacumbae]
MRTSLSISAGVAVLALLAGCSGSGDQKLSSQDPTTTDTTTTAPPSEPTSPPTSAPSSAPVSTAPPAGPLTQAQYQTALIRLDQRLAGDINALGRVKTEDSLTAAMENLTQALNAESLALGSIKPPARAVAANRVLQLRLKAAASALSSGDTSDVGCGGLAFVSQALQRQLTTTLSVAVTQLRTVGLVFGRTLPDLGPDPSDARPSNGDVIVRSGAGGSGALRVKNGSAVDVAISIVSPGKPPGKPHIMLYVQSKKTATVYRIGGGYSLYVKSGKDWNPKRRQFSSDCSFKKFDQSFSRNSGWEVQLKPSVLGNATSTTVDPY